MATKTSKKSVPVAPAHANLPVLFLRGTEEYRGFTDKVMQKTFMSKSAMYRLAFRQWCIVNGHGTPPDL